MVKAERKVEKYFDELSAKGVLSKWHLSLISDVYEAVKVGVAKDLYMDIVSVCVISILEEENVSYENLVDKVTKTLGLERNNHVEISLKSITDPYASKDEKDDGVRTSKRLVSKDALYDSNDDSMDKALKSTIDSLRNNSNDLTNPIDVCNAIFLDVIVNGLTREQAAKKYRMTLSAISSIIEERKEAVTDMLVVDYDVVVKDVETREPYKSLVKQVTDSNK